MQYTAYLAQGLAAVVFVSSGVAKLRDVNAFTSYVDDLQLLPSALAAPTARCLAILEVGAGVLSAMPASRTIGLGLAEILLLALSGGVVLLLYRGSRSECACFGRRTSPLGWRHLVRNSVLAVAVGAGLLTALAHHPAPQPAGLAIACIAGVIVAALILSWDDVADLFATPSSAQSAAHSKGRPDAISRRSGGRTRSARPDPAAVHAGDRAAGARAG